MMSSVAVSAVLAAPWLAFLASQGGILQNSASARPILQQISVFRAIRRTVYFAAGDAGHGLLWIGPTAFGAAIAFVVVAIAVCLASGRADRAWLSDLAGLVTGTFILFVLYAVALRATRPWYNLYAALLFVLLVLPPIFAAIWKPVRIYFDTTKIQMGTVIGVTIAIVTLAAISDVPQHPQEVDKYHAAEAIAASSSQRGQRLGSFNAGILGYFIPEKVLDLDGVVNPGVQASLRSHELCHYLHQQGVTEIVDTPQYLDQLSKLAPGLWVTRTSVLVGPGSRTPVVAEVQKVLAIDTSACSVAS
jgi:hypothetical protein